MNIELSKVRIPVFECPSDTSGLFTLAGQNLFGWSRPNYVACYSADGITDMAIEYLRAYRRPEPLFLVVSIDPPHFPLTAPERFRRCRRRLPC